MKYAKGIVIAKNPVKVIKLGAMLVGVNFITNSHHLSKMFDSIQVKPEDLYLYSNLLNASSGIQPLKTLIS